MKLQRISIKTTCIATLFVAAYFMIWRPVRVLLVQNVVRPTVEAMISSSSSSFFIFHSNDLTFHLQDTHILKNSALRKSVTANKADREANISNYTAYTFKGFGGRFFLICGFTLLLFGFFKLFWWLFLFHQASTLLLFIFTSAGLFIHSSFFYAFDLVNVYLIPSFSVIFVLIAMKSDNLSFND